MVTKPTLNLPPLNARWVALGTLIVVSIAAGFLLLFRFRVVVLIFFFGIFISITIRPVVDWLFRRGIPRRAGVILVFVVAVALLTALILSGAPLIVDQVTRFTQQLPELYEQLRGSLIEGRIGPFLRVGLRLPEELSLSGGAPASDEEAIPLLRQSMAQVNQAARIILGIIATGLVAFYWTLDGERVKRGLLLLFPTERRERQRDLIADLENRLGKYTAGMGLLMLIIGALSFVAYLIIGLPYALFLALLAGLFEAVPTVGPTLAAIPAALVAYSISPTHALWVVVATLVIQQIENSILVPRVMKQAVGVPPLVTLLAIITFTLLFGVAGAIVAVPMAAVVSAIFERRVLEAENAVNMEPGGRDRLSVLRYETQQLLADVRRRSREEEPDAEPDDERSAIRDDLEGIVTELETILGVYQNGDEENGNA
ncbi:MAG: AI-2E family transporter [Chloroflexi bacterium]|nr:AI-2E family transporter [Chloroflexota bacterium]